MSRRDEMIDALGIGPQWMRRTIGAQRSAAAPTEAGMFETASETAHVASVEPGAALPASTRTSAPVSARVSAPISAPAVVPPTDTEIAAMDWASLQAAVSTCTRCRLCESRTRTVFGVGDPDPAWLFVGEGPGRNEDREGQPFIGPAGKLLDNMLAAVSLDRRRGVFIANVVKCRPTDADGKDRAPASDEIAACRPYLERQIALLKPTLLVALGKTAALALLQRPPATTLSALRGEVHHYAALPMVVTYHPAYLLRVPSDKRKTWDDLCLAIDVHLAQSSSAAPA